MSLGLYDHLIQFDHACKSLPQHVIAGVDEAGRGPLAGPVMAAAVIFIRETPLPHLNDSKKLSKSRRESLFIEISKHACIGVGLATEAEIDELNIYHASRLAMKRAVCTLSRTPDLVLIDGKNMRLDLPLPQKSIIGGDRKSASIAAASIIAKVYRDAWMGKLDLKYPEYQFRQHQGYPTPEHCRLLLEHGPSPIHRKTFRPVIDAELKYRHRAKTDKDLAVLPQLTHIKR